MIHFALPNRTAAPISITRKHLQFFYIEMYFGKRAISKWEFSEFSSISITFDAAEMQHNWNLKIISLLMNSYHIN